MRRSQLPREAKLIVQGRQGLLRGIAMFWNRVMVRRRKDARNGCGNPLSTYWLHATLRAP